MGVPTGAGLVDRAVTKALVAGEGWGGRRAGWQFQRRGGGPGAVVPGG